VLLSDLGELLNHAYKVLKQAFDDYWKNSLENKVNGIT
jgi:hypothetical protein